MHTSAPRAPRVLLLLALAVLAASTAPACSGGGDSALLRADVARAAPSPADLEAARATANSNAAFGWDLYRRIAAEEGNVFVSPHSISVALAMVYAGAAGDTAAEMAKTLRYDVPPAQLHAAFNALALSLEEADKAASGKKEPFRLSVVNSAWAQKDHPFLQPYLETLARGYGAGIRLVDYTKDAEGARKTINAWVSDETEKRIKDLLPRGSLDDLTRLVLANAVYFKADWEQPFDKEETRPGPFTRLDGSPVQADMMHESELSARYAEDGDVQALELRYAGGRMSMLVLLPRAGRFAAAERAMDADRVSRIIAMLAPATVNVTLPKFEFTRGTDLGATLKAMGMVSAFQPDTADFSGMDGTRQLYISGVYHKAFVRVDEKGTEAAAATAAVIGTTSAPVGVVQFAADRPFLFLIRDNETGATLFLGRVVDPTAKE